MSTWYIFMNSEVGQGGVQFLDDTCRMKCIIEINAVNIAYYI
jgi:hypothetical protein